MITVERATEEDIVDILDIDRTLGIKDRSAFVVAAVRQRQGLIAREGEQRLGYALVHSHFYGYPFIELLVVHPDARRRGVASALLAYIEKTRPGEKLFTSTNQSNGVMQALLEKCGYVRSGQIDHLDEGDPELVYFKRLERP
jgi:ribosomal protein S18 acetylase RimI-like enzyme